MIDVVFETLKNFKQLRIWKKGLDIAIQAYDLVKTFPKEERFALANQITRAAVSVASNIAEGSSRESVKEYRRFIQIALGSSYELETQILIACAVGFGEKEIRDNLLVNILDEQKMLTGFLSKLTSLPG